MSKEKVPSLEDVLSDDPGDETQRRFRYQAQCAALISLALLDETSELACIYCEHHEDILVKKKNGDFIGVQVKTRDSGLGPFKAKDVQIIKSLKRFVVLERDFSDSFLSFDLSTNNSFWREKKNKSNLWYILDLVSSTSPTDGLDSTLSDYFKEFSDIENISDQLILKALSKVRLNDKLPKFEDMELRISHEINGLSNMGDKRMDELKTAAKALTSKMFEAASLSSNPPEKYYFFVIENPGEEITKSTIEGKRITKETVEDVLQETLDSEHLLASWKHIPISDLPTGMRKMELKMAGGGISLTNIDLAKDHKFSAESLLKEWCYKYDPKKAEERYEHLRTIVRTESQEAHDLKMKSSGLYGQEMLNEVRNRLRRRHETEFNSFFGCKYEHLLGIAGIITENCELWWSDEFDISGEK